MKPIKSTCRPSTNSQCQNCQAHTENANLRERLASLTAAYEALKQENILQAQDRELGVFLLGEMLAGRANGEEE